MPGHVEGDDAKILGDARIVHDAAILPAVGAGGVQAEQGNALAGLLDIEPMRTAEHLEMHVAAGDGLEARLHEAALLRSEASTSLK